MPEHATVITGTAARHRRVDHWFYIGVALFVIVISVAGFAPSIVDQSRRNAPMTLLVGAHGIVAASWLFLFLLQSLLVGTGRTDVHRRLGRMGPILAVTMIVVGVLMLRGDPDGSSDLSGDLARALSPPGAPRLSPEEALPGVLFPLAGFLNFGVLVALGLWYRRRPEIHKRLMLFALFPLVVEPVMHLIGYLAGHFPALQGAGGVIASPASLLLLLVSATHDKLSQGRIHPVSLWTPALLFVWQSALALVVFPSAVWREFAFWLAR
jgi:uncharacterized membrane protein YozB (DUF420 family)